MLLESNLRRLMAYLGSPTKPTLWLSVDFAQSGQKFPPLTEGGAERQNSGRNVGPFRGFPSLKYTLCRIIISNMRVFFPPFRLRVCTCYTCVTRVTLASTVAYLGYFRENRSISSISPRHRLEAEIGPKSTPKPFRCDDIEPLPAGTRGEKFGPRSVSIQPVTAQ